MISPRTKKRPGKAYIATSNFSFCAWSRRCFIVPQVDMLQSRYARGFFCFLRDFLRFFRTFSMNGSARGQNEPFPLQSCSTTIDQDFSQWKLPIAHASDGTVLTFVSPFCGRGNSHRQWAQFVRPTLGRKKTTKISRYRFRGLREMREEEWKTSVGFWGRLADAPRGRGTMGRGRDARGRGARRPRRAESEGAAGGGEQKGRMAGSRAKHVRAATADGRCPTPDHRLSVVDRGAESRFRHHAQTWVLQWRWERRRTTVPIPQISIPERRPGGPVRQWGATTARQQAQRDSFDRRIWAFAAG